MNVVKLLDGLELDQEHPLDQKVGRILPYGDAIIEDSDSVLLFGLDACFAELMGQSILVHLLQKSASKCVADGEGTPDHPLRQLAHLAWIESAFIRVHLRFHLFLVQCSKAETLSANAGPRANHPAPRRCRPETGHLKPQMSHSTLRIRHSKLQVRRLKQHLRHKTALVLAKTRSWLANDGGHQAATSDLSIGTRPDVAALVHRFLMHPTCSALPHVRA